jgi:hypothetical protein
MPKWIGKNYPAFFLSDISSKTDLFSPKWAGFFSLHFKIQTGISAMRSPETRSEKNKRLLPIWSTRVMAIKIKIPLVPIIIKLDLR